MTHELHLFYLCDCDFVSAADLDDAAIADDKRIAVAEHEGRGAPKTTKTAREWAQHNGRGLAFSTEY